MIKKTICCLGLFALTFTILWSPIFAKGITIKANKEDFNFLNVYYNDAFFDLKSYLNNKPDNSGVFTSKIDPLFYPAIITCEYYGEHFSFLAFENKVYTFKKDAANGPYVEEAGMNKSLIYKSMEKSSGSFRSGGYPIPLPKNAMSLIKASGYRKNIRDSILSSSDLMPDEKKFYKDWISYSAWYDNMLPYAKAPASYDFEQLPQNYVSALNNLSSLFNNDALLNNDKYRIAANLYNRFLTYLKFKNNDFGNLYLTASNFFEGKTKDMVTFRLLKENIKNNVPGYDRCYQDFKKKCTTDIYATYMDSIYTIYKSAIPGNVLLTSLTASNDSALTFGKLFKNNPNKLMYIDFWASWCVPCRGELPYSKDLIKCFDDKKIAFIFLSLDTDKNKWLEAEKTYDFLNTENSYLISEAFKSDLVKRYNITSIPRYILINNKGVIIDVDAQRPRSTELKALIGRLLINK